MVGGHVALEKSEQEQQCAQHVGEDDKRHFSGYSDLLDAAPTLSPHELQIGHITGFSSKLLNQPFHVHPKDLGFTSKFGRDFGFFTNQFYQSFHEYSIGDIGFTSKFVYVFGFFTTQFHQLFHEHSIGDIGFTSKMVEILQCRFHFCLRCLGVFQKFIVGVFLGISTFKIFFWRTKLAILKKEKYTENLKNTTSEVKITIDESLLWNMTPKSKDKVSQYINERPGAAEPKTLNSNAHQCKEHVKKVQFSCDTRAFVKAEKDPELETLKLQLDYIRKDLQMAEEAMARGSQEQTNMEKQLSAKEEKLNSTTAEIEECKSRIHQLQEELQQEERSFACQVSTQYRKSLDSWHRANALEQELVHHDREAEYLRLEMMKLAEGYKRQEPALGGPGWENQARRDAGAPADPGRRSGPVPAKHAQNAQVNMEARRCPPARRMRNKNRSCPPCKKYGRMRYVPKNTLYTIYEEPEPH
ncbi:transport and Golgi organization protein 1 homolog isoform X2 [Lepus europaeus]|uniref:transport and Golgi organization protein 1 homolog isoform X2 n=1 Tax=Lepus europaeus TaxID=9983 RepID=UPI002B477394|nr:transport and Golgi organization protein 1 homolog isoform X2 [Lepus europaeus]